MLESKMQSGVQFDRLWNQFKKVVDRENFAGRPKTNGSRAVYYSVIRSFHVSSG